MQSPKTPSATERPPSGALDRWRQIAATAWNGWNSDQAPVWSAALAFYSLFSLAPILLIATTLAGAFYGEDAIQGRLQQQLQGVMGESGSQFAAELVRRTQLQEAGWWPTITGLVLVLYGSTIVTNTLQQAFDTIWDLEGDHDGYLSWLLDHLMSIGIALFAGVLLLASVVIGTAMSTATDWLDRWTTVPGWARVAADGAVTLGIVVVLFAVLFRYLPSARPGWRDVWLGAVITGVLFALGRAALSLYLGRAAVTSTYGAAGTLVVVLLWVYYSAQILLAGAELTWARMQVLGRRPQLQGGARPRRTSTRGSDERARADERHAHAP